ncbi:MAG: helix-turn-helix domain-containing protein [Eubacterium sp.]|nr:helix-turn-helix domain-containing protein [Eubacterium sp.]
MTINDNIRKLRLQKRMTQEELGECLGISGQAVSKWEQGITSPDILLLPVLAGCFGVTIDSLFANEISRRYPGYGGERGELLASYEESGLEKDFQKAEEALGEVILHEKATTEDYFNYGLLYQIRFHKDSDIALCYYRKGIEHGNQNRDLFWMAAHQQITNLLESMGRLEEAIAEHKKWRDTEPDCAWAHVSYSNALSRAGHLEEAYAEAMEAFRLDANDCNVLTNAGDLCSKMGKYEEAIFYWDKSYACDSSQISCLFSKAEMFASTGQTEEAIRQFEEILIWLNTHGYNMELEGAHPRQRICELREQLS